MESELEREAAIIMERVSKKASIRSISLTTIKKVGNPATVIPLVAKEMGADLIVVGSRQNRPDIGFKARIAWTDFLANCGVPVIVAPPVS